MVPINLRRGLGNLLEVRKTCAELADSPGVVIRLGFSRIDRIRCRLKETAVGQ